jgi:hypothetical protein
VSRGGSDRLLRHQQREAVVERYELGRKTEGGKDQGAFFAVGATVGSINFDEFHGCALARAYIAVVWYSQDRTA